MATTYNHAREVRTGYWIFYNQNGTKKEEGNYLPVEVLTSTDSVKLIHDPWEKGKLVYANLRYTDHGSQKTGWWKVYDEKGILIREERYENGELKETKKQ